MDEYEPRAPELVVVWSRLSPEVRRSRLAEARRRQAALDAVAARPAGESERRAIARVVPWTHRSNVRRWQGRYRAHGLDGLVDWRMPQPSPMSDVVRAALCTLRRADPEVAVETLVAHVAKHHAFVTSATTVKRVLREEGLARRRGPPSGVDTSQAHRLELGGMKLVEAACVETGYVAALVRSVVAQVEGLPAPAGASGPETEDRDEYGRFQASYNDRFRKEPGDAIGPGFASVSEKRAGKSPERLQVGHVRPAVIERKLLGLLVSPLIGSGRWDGMRVPRGELLGEVCGVAYMPATLDRFTRELKYAGVASTLWEVHARKWLEQTRGWGDERRAAVVYVDGTTKPVWTRLFSESTKVSSVGRVMPGLEQVAFHTGYGVPVWMLTHSGRAPLVRAVPAALDRLEAMWGSSSVGRIVVIDAEGNSVPFLKGLEQGEPSRAWVTRLRPDWVKGKRIFNRSNYRAYRNGDRVRCGVADFNDPSGGTFRMRVVELLRRTTGEVTHLGASTLLDEREWGATELADLYFDRWPAQEANFRAVSQAAGFKEVHGYGKRLVDNVSVVTELDALTARTRRAAEKLDRDDKEVVTRRGELLEAERELSRTKRRQETVDRQVRERVVPGRAVTLSAEELVSKQRALADEVAAGAERVATCRKKLDLGAGRAKKTAHRLAGYRGRQAELEERRTIFAHDVELDSLFSLLKVGLVLLVTYVLKEYLGDARMAALTFLERVATLPARLVKTPELEIVTFEYNRRDPEVMGLLQAHCAAINARKLRLRSGRCLRVNVEEAPEPARPKPPGSRTGSGDRFKR